MSAGVLLAVIGPLEPALVRALAPHRGAVQVQRRCSDLAELLAAASAGVGSIAVIDAASGLIDAEMVRQLHVAQLRVVLIAHRDDHERTAALGADTVVAGDTPAEAIAEQVAALAERDVCELVVAKPAAETTALPATKTIVLSGPPGSTGRSTLAVALADLLSSLAPTLLLDADLAAPSIDVRLSILDDVSGFATCARRANQGRLNLEVLRQAAQPVGELAVLTGIGNASRWEEILPATIPTIMRTASEYYQYIVVDTESVPWPEADSYDQFRMHPGMVRNAVLDCADTVLHVARADTDGMRRLLTYLHDIELSPRDHLVVTQVAASSAGASPQATVLEVLARFSAAERATLIRDDRRSCEAALLNGVPLTTIAARSPASHDIAHLAAQLTGRRRIASSGSKTSKLTGALKAAAIAVLDSLRPAPAPPRHLGPLGRATAPEKRAGAPGSGEPEATRESASEDSLLPVAWLSEDDPGELLAPAPDRQGDAHESKVCLAADDNQRPAGQERADREADLPGVPADVQAANEPEAAGFASAHSDWDDLFAPSECEDGGDEEE